ncbi:lysostaphin resistance A-like protein [Actinoplanes sp. NPDC049599]|uniref:lysostaphin resistance A-like protein n=1 Tax=Actinoplanes sp. NPDC049599 TaxID=3363903 RepID=UPI0037AC6330
MEHTDTTGRRARLGWRVAIVFAAATLIWRLVDRVGDVLFGPGYERGRHVFSAVAVTALVVPMIVLAYRRLDRLPWAGLRRAAPGTALRLLLLGAAGYLVPAGVAVAALAAPGRLEIGLRAPAAGAVLSALALVLLVFLYEALPEELIFRGYLYRNLATALPRWGAVLGQAALFALFGLAVGAATTADRVVLFLGFAVVQGAVRAVTDTLWVPIGFHLAFQTAEQLVGPSWDVFTVGDLALVQQVALGLVPLVLGVPVILLLRRSLGRRLRAVITPR